VVQDELDGDHAAARGRAHVQLGFHAIHGGPAHRAGHDGLEERGDGDGPGLLFEGHPQAEARRLQPQVEQVITHPDIPYVQSIRVESCARPDPYAVPGRVGRDPEESVHRSQDEAGGVQRPRRCEARVLGTGPGFDGKDVEGDGQERPAGVPAEDGPGRPCRGAEARGEGGIAHVGGGPLKSHGRGGGDDAVLGAGAGGVREAFGGLPNGGPCHRRRAEVARPRDVAAHEKRDELREVGIDGVQDAPDPVRPSGCQPGEGQGQCLGGVAGNTEGWSPIEYVHSGSQVIASGGGLQDSDAVGHGRPRLTLPVARGRMVERGRARNGTGRCAREGSMRRRAEKRAMLCAVALVLLPVSGHAQEDALLPPDRQHAPPVADPSAPRLSVALMRTNLLGAQARERAPFQSPDADRETVATISLGAVLPLVRLAEWSGGGAALVLEAKVFGRFRVQEPGRDDMGQDWIIGGGVEARHDAWSGRTMVSHRSSHLGDEFIEGTGARRIEYGNEQLEFVAAYDAAGLARLYGGGAWIFRSYLGWDPHLRTLGIRDRAGVQLGVDREWRPFTDRRVGVWGGVDWQAAERTSWRGALAVAAGIGIGTSRTLRLVARYYDGPSTMGQFFLTREQTFAIELMGAL
jgi:hypothetical protein